MAQIAQILDLYKISKAENKPLFGETTDLSNYDFMADYISKYQKFDRKFVSERASFAPVWNLNYEDDTAGVLSTFREDIDSFLTKYEENLTRLYTLMTIEYEPLQNYSMTEEGDDTNSGKDSVEDKIAQRQDTTVNGERLQTDITGARTASDINGQVQVTDVIGSQTNSDQLGARQRTDSAQTNSDQLGARSRTDGSQTNTSEEKTSAFNSSDYADKEHITDILGSKTTSDAAVTDTHTIGQKTVNDAAVTDSHTLGGHSDTHTTATYTDQHTSEQATDTHRSQSVTDTFTSGAHTDTHDTTYGKKLHHELTRFGNIGVTTSQQMAQSEVDLWGSFNFYSILFDMIIRELCTLYEPGLILM